MNRRRADLILMSFSGRLTAAEETELVALQEKSLAAVEKAFPFNESEDNMDGFEVKGRQFGVRLIARGKTDPHVCLQLLSEDDENWFEKGRPFSSFWLADLVRVLETTKAVLDAHCEPSPDGFGYRFKET